MYDFITDALRHYLAGRMTLHELDSEIASFNWSDRSPEALAARPLVGDLLQVIIEVAEGLREESELREFAREALTPPPTRATA
ncbi:MAG: hypothetical protein NTZ05_22730 [Chloroflexi bacterium]|nr:hypothetical protein [Chloroflexota bacterium]